jgi:hypothetical protein
MPLVKALTSTRTGAPIGFHVVTSVSFVGDKANIGLSNYVDQASFAAGKMPLEGDNAQVPFTSGAVSPSPILWAEAQLIAAVGGRYNGATQV